MKIFDVKISDTATLTCFIAGVYPEMPGVVRDAMLVLPGGGYGMCSDREGEPVVRKYLAAGLNCFMLKYSTGENARDFAPLVEASLAMAHIRDNSAEYGIDPERVFAVGFSAGGHLCASLGTFWNAPWLLEKLDMPYGKNKPTGTVLSYAVISGGEIGHEGSFYNISGKTRSEDPEIYERYSVEKHVSADSAPAFIWSTSDDGCVNVENSLMLAAAFKRAGMQFEMHIFPHGPHGLSIAEYETSVNNPALIDQRVATWVQLSLEWMKGL